MKDKTNKRHQFIVSKNSPAYKVYQEIVNQAEQDSEIIQLIESLSSSNTKKAVSNQLTKRLHYILRTQLNKTPIPLTALLKASSVVENNLNINRLVIEKHLDNLIEKLVEDELILEKTDSSFTFN